MGSSTKCPKCGNWYDSNTVHVCGAFGGKEDLYFKEGSEKEGGPGIGGQD